MIYGIGTDIVNIARIEKSLAKFGDIFAKKILSEKEMAVFAIKKDNQASYLAKRFAAKEAFAKALGTGFRGEISLKHVEILNDELGKPSLCISGAAQKTLQKLAGDKANLHLSLSDDYPTAIAFVVIGN
jgi:holo-[acyl-carrier protein] synthase